MIKILPKILIPFYLIVFIVFAIIILQLNIFNLSAEDVGYNSLFLVAIIIFLLIPLQLFLLLAKLIYFLWKKYKNDQYILIPFYLIIFIVFAIIILQLNIFNLSAKDVGYNSLFLVAIIIFLLIPLQLFLLLAKLIYFLWKKYKNDQLV